MRVRTVAMLLAGRGVGRLAQYAAALALLTVWGPTTFADYATATGVGLWLFSFSATGVERAALLSVGGRDGRRLESLFVWLALTPFVLALAAWGLLAVTRPGSAGTVTAGIALMCGAGTATVLVALFRLRGRPGIDAATYVTLSVGYLAVVLLAVAGGGVRMVFGALVGLVAALNLALLAALRPTWGVRYERDEVVVALRATFLLAAGDTLGNMAVSVLYAVMAVAAPAGQASVLYVCLVVSVAVGTVTNYLMRLWQPNILVWVVNDAAGLRRRLRRRLVLASAAGTTACVAVGAVVVALGTGRTSVLLALALEIATFLAVSAGAFVAESVDDRARLHSASSAVVGLVVVAGLSWLLVPVAGAAGALVALAAGWVARGPLLSAGTRDRPLFTPHPSLPAARADDTPSAPSGPCRRP